MPRAVFMFPTACALAVATVGCGANSVDTPGTPTSTVSPPGTAGDASTSTGTSTAPVDASDLNLHVLMELRPTENRAISVGCPEDLPAEVGATVTCDVEALNGRQLRVTVTATNVTGGTVDYEITGIA